MKQLMLRLNLFLLGVIVLNLLCFLLFDISLRAKLIWFVKVLYYLSGVISFFLWLKPFTYRTVYLGYFVISPVITFVAWLFDRIFGVIVFGVFYFWLIPTDVVYENDQFTLYRPVNGIIGSCCKFEVYEDAFIFERKLGSFTTYTTIEFDSSDLQIDKGKNEIIISDANGTPQTIPYK